jgi:ABC-type branched-subunit amino acid transport system substrate-binding protein
MRARLAGVLVLLAITAACGARVTDEQRASAGAFTAPGGSTTGDRAVQDATADQGSGQELAVGAPAGATAGGASTATAPSAGSPASNGDNGGATDVGVTASEVRIGNVSTLSGPVPGLFRGAVIGTQAAIAYQNSLGGVHGRRLVLEVRDDQLDSAQNRAATRDLLDKVFAFAGSFAVYDDASAADVGESGIPDVTSALSGARRRLPNNFNVAPAEDGGTQLGPFAYYKSKFPEEIKAAGTLWGDVPISRSSQMANEAAGTSLGWNFIYSRGYQPTETDFTADVVRMRQEGVRIVYLAGSEPKTLARIAKAMRQQSFNVPIVTMNIGYDPSLIPLAGDALEGMYTTMAWSMFAGEDAAQVPEVRLMNQWMQKVKPGYAPDLYALLGWASGRLLFKAMDQVGPHLTRAAVNDALHNSGNFDANQLLAPADPGKKVPPTCIVITILRHGRFERTDTPASGFRCDLGGYFRTRR